MIGNAKGHSVSPRFAGQDVWSRRLGLSSRLVLILLCCFAAASDASAQGVAVRGVVQDAASGRPVVGARVFLSMSGVRVASSVVGARGEFALTAPGVPVEVTISALGAQDWTATIADDSGANLGIVRLQMLPFELAGLSVSAQSVCGSEVERLEAGARAIAAIRPRLGEIARNNALTGAEYVVDLVRSHRDVWPDGRLLFSKDTSRLRLPSVLVGEDPDRLAREGFAVALSDSVNEYRAATPEWFASSDFESGYCLSLNASDALEFWPKDSLSVVGVAGAIELGEEGPTHVSYRYTNLRAFVELHEIPWLESYYRARTGVARVPIRGLQFNPDRHGGTLTFAEVGDGLFMTTAWLVNGVVLFRRADYERGELVLVSPRTASLETSARLIAVAPAGGG